MATSKTRVGARRPTKAAVVPGRSLRLILSTCPARSAARLARALVDARLAACVNVVPGLTSVYRWEGAVESARECLMVVKTTAARIAQLERAIASEHPYELAECVVLAPAHVETRYAAWIASSVGGA